MMDKAARWVRGMTAAGFLLLATWSAYRWFAHNEPGPPLWGTLLASGIGLPLLIELAFPAHNKIALAAWSAMAIAASMLVLASTEGGTLFGIGGTLFMLVGLAITIVPAAAERGSSDAR
jgi:hypothetical protein